MGGGFEIHGLNLDVLRSFNCAFEDQARKRCRFCLGNGHELNECMSLINLTRSARSCGLGFHWGAIKGLTYYREMNTCANVA